MQDIQELLLDLDPDYHYWAKACHAVKHRLPLPEMADGHPERGLGYYWITRVRGGPKLPVAIYTIDAEVIITIDGMPVAPSKYEYGKIWNIVARHPVEYKGMFDVRERTGSWPGEIVEPREAAIGDNAAPSETPTPDVILLRELDALSEWLRGKPVDTDERATEYTTRARELQRLQKLVEKLHEDEKAPHYAKCKEIDDKYLPLIRSETKTQDAGRAVKAVKWLFAKVDEWTNAKKEAARKIAAAAEDARQAELRRMEEAAKASAQNSLTAQGDMPLPEAVAPTIPPIPVAPPPPEQHTYGGIVGNRASQRTVKNVVFEGESVEEIAAARDLCYQTFRNHPDVAEVLLKLAKAIVKAKMSAPPGTKIVEETVTR